MEDLTTEQQQSLYLREKARLEAQHEFAAKKKKKLKYIGIVCFSIILSGALFIFCDLSSIRIPYYFERSPSGLMAEVKYFGNQVIITNRDPFDWKNIRIELSTGRLRGGYYLEIPSIRAGETSGIEISKFANNNGDRINPIELTFHSIKILVDSPNGRVSYTRKPE